MNRPVTRWAFPPPWLTLKDEPEPALPTPSSKQRRTRVKNPDHPAVLAATETGSPTHTAEADATPERPAVLAVSSALERQLALLSLLDRDLHHGYKYVAARHLMMLEAERLPIPPSVRERCAALLASCSTRRLDTIARQVQDWRAVLH